MDVDMENNSGPNIDEMDAGTQCDLGGKSGHENSASSSNSASTASTPSSNGNSGILGQKVDADGFPPGVELRQISDQVGRGVFATRDFKAGEIIFTDHPIVSSQFAWNRMYRYKACDYCMRAMETAEENVRRLTQKPNLSLPFPECCDTNKETQVDCPDCENHYCCEECRVKAWQEFHSVLCPMTRVPKESHPLVVLDTFWRLIHYPPETCNIFLLVKLLVKLHFDKSLRLRLSQFCQGTTDENNVLAHKMLGEEHLDQLNKLRLLVSTVVTFPDIQEYLTQDGFLQLFVLIGRNGQGVGSSSFARWVENIEELKVPDQIGEKDKAELLARVDEIYHTMDGVVGHFLDNEGSALYPIQSWVNHSCVPNTEVKFPSRNHEIGLVAKRDIWKGEEITITYLDLGDMERSRYSRNKYLKEHYLFECRCEKCEAQAGDEEGTSEDDSEDEDDDEDIESDGDEIQMDDPENAIDV